MGERGPAPLPTKILELRGSRWAKEAKRGEIRPPEVAPPTPPHLSGPALAEWERIVPLLERAGLIAELDLALLTLYVETWERYVAASAGLKAGGYLWIEKGRARVSPYHDLVTKEGRRLLLLGRKLGLSASDRRGLAAIDDSEGGEDELTRWKKRHGRA